MPEDTEDKVEAVEVATEPIEDETPAPASDPGEKMFSQSQLDEIVKKRVAKAKRGAKKPASTPEVKPTNGEPTVADLMAKMERMEHRNEWKDAALVHKLEPAQSADFYDLWNAKKPEGTMEDFITSKLSIHGGKPETTTPEDPKVDAPKVSLTPPRKVDRFGTKELVDVTTDLELDEIERLGPEGVRKLFEAVLEDGHTKSGAPPMPRMLKKG